MFRRVFFYVVLLFRSDVIALYKAGKYQGGMYIKCRICCPIVPEEQKHYPVPHYEPQVNPPSYKPAPSLEEKCNQCSHVFDKLDPELVQFDCGHYYCKECIVNIMNNFKEKAELASCNKGGCGKKFSDDILMQVNKKKYNEYYGAYYKKMHKNG